MVHPPSEGGRPDNLPYHVDYKAAYQRHLKANNAHKSPNGHAAMHLIIGVSKEFFDKPDGTHEGHDFKSEKVRKLLVATTQWAEAELGGVWAARYDLDEKGFGIVDLMCSPVRKHGKSGNNHVSIRKAQAELKQKYPGAARGYGPMQSSWADYATKILGETFDRGIPKRITRREHLIAEEYGEAMDAGRKRVSELEAEAGRMAKKLREMAETALGLKKQIDQMRVRMQKASKAAARLRNRLTAWAVSRYRAASRPSLPPDPENEDLAEEAIVIATAMTAAIDTGTPAELHRERIQRKVRKKRREGGWGADHPEAPLHEAWEAAIKEQAESERLSYEDWRHELAHGSARGLGPDQRDLIRLARRVEKSLGQYLTRAERRRRQQAGDPDVSGGGIGR